MERQLSGSAPDHDDLFPHGCVEVVMSPIGEQVELTTGTVASGAASDSNNNNHHGGYQSITKALVEPSSSDSEPSTRSGRLRAQIRSCREEINPVPTLKAAACWTLFYIVVWGLFVLFADTVLGMEDVFQWIGIIVLSFGFVMLINNAKRREMPSPGLLFGMGLTCLLLWKPVIYTRTFNILRPCQKFENILHELHHSPSLEPNLNYDDLRNPLQAKGLDNVHLRLLGEALTVHFDRYAHNQTEEFKYVEHLNLIANVFDDKGVGHLVEALEHKFAYTTTILLGRNRNIGDESVRKIADLIESRDPLLIGAEKNTTKTDPSGNYLTWLELGGSSVTAQGLVLLYEAMGTRRFEFLGLEYTDRAWVKRLPFFWRPIPIPNSVLKIKEAIFLEEISLTGNTLTDKDMPGLVESVLQTDMTALGLLNNRIGSQGVEYLLPLTKQLTKLELGFNRMIGSKGAALLAEALKHPNSTVETLTLFNCQIGQEGAQALLSIFPSNTELKYLIVDTGKDSGIKDDTLQALRKAVQANWKNR